MANDVHIEWDANSIADMLTRMSEHAQNILAAVQAIADYFAPVLEADAKENAPWTDQTGNARQSLHAFTKGLGEEAVELYLAHGMDYGKYLELRWQGKYAIIWPTLEQHIPAVEKMLKMVFS